MGVNHKSIKFYRAFLNDIKSCIWHKLVKRMPVSILLYHQLPKDFEWQIEYLHKNNYRVISLQNLLELLKSSKRISPKTIVLTFDDGYLDSYLTAFPILKKYNYPASVFLATDYVDGTRLPKNDRQRTINWEEVKEMHNSGLIDFQPHTLSHPKLHRINLETVEGEMLGSKEKIEKTLNKKCIFFAYPSGRYSEDIKKLGSRFFEMCLTTDRGFVDRGQDRFSVPRNAIDDLVSKPRFMLKI